jgi:hypothetical protein
MLGLVLRLCALIGLASRLRAFRRDDEPRRSTCGKSAERTRKTDAFIAPGTRFSPAGVLDCSWAAAGVTPKRATTMLPAILGDLPVSQYIARLCTHWLARDSDMTAVYSLAKAGWHGTIESQSAS